MPLSPAPIPEHSENFEIPSISLKAGQSLPTPEQFKAVYPELYSVHKVRDHLRLHVKIPSFTIRAFTAVGPKIESRYRQALETCFTQLEENQIEFRTSFKQNENQLEGRLYIANNSELAEQMIQISPVLFVLHQLHDAIKKANASIDAAKENLESKRSSYHDLETERQTLVGPVNKPAKYPTSPDEFSEKKKRLGIVKQELGRSEQIINQHVLILDALQTHLARLAVMVMDSPNFLEKPELLNWIREMRAEPSDSSAYVAFGRAFAAYQPHQEIRVHYPHISRRKFLTKLVAGFAISVPVFALLSEAASNRDRILTALGLGEDPRLNTPFFKNEVPDSYKERIKNAETQTDLLNVLIQMMGEVGPTAFQSYVNSKIVRHYATHPAFPGYVLMSFENPEILSQVEAYFGGKVALFTKSSKSKDAKVTPSPYIPEIKGYKIPKNDFCNGYITLRANVSLPSNNVFQLDGNIEPNHELAFFKEQCL